VDSLTWRDERDGGQWKLSALKLATGRIADDAPGKMTLAARIEGANPPLGADIDMASDYRFNFTRHTASFSGISLTVAGDLPSMQGVRLAMSGQMDADWATPGQEKAGGTLTAKFDESTLKAKFDVQGFSPAAISFDADIDKLDTDRYQTKDAKGGGAKPGNGAKRAEKGQAGEQPLDLEGLKALNLKGQLRIGQLQAAGLKAEKVQLGLNAKGGRVDLNPVAASLYGGTLAGMASVNAHTYQFTARQQLAGINIGPLLRDLADKDLLEGRGKVNLDVQTTGRTVTALKKALAGSASVALADGALKGINLAEALRKAKAVLGSKSAQEQAASQNGNSGDKTDFSELSASFAIAKGVAHNEDLSMKSPFLRLGGAGDLDIGEDRMNYLAKASVVNTSAGQGGKDLESLAGLTVPVRISGPFESLSYRIEMGSLVSDTVKQQVKEKVQEEIKGRLQDRLKGLLQR
jgi:AsmA protein